MMEAELLEERTDSCNIVISHLIRVGEEKYYLMLIRQIYGGFIMIPNRNILCRASVSTHSFCYNADMMEKAGLEREVAETLAKYIDKWTFLHKLDDFTIMKWIDIPEKLYLGTEKDY